MDLFEFHNPWVLLLAVPILALLRWRYRNQNTAAALVFPSVARFSGLRPTLRQRARVLVPLLQVLALLLFVGAAARPREGDERTIVKSQGIAIQMVIDRSSSMNELIQYESTERRRIDVVKSVFRKFVEGDEELRGRKTDLIGLTTFSRFTEENCPLVSQHEPLLTAVSNLNTVDPALDQYGRPVRDIDRARRQRIKLLENPLNATAIGDGLYRAVLSLVTAEADLEESDGSSDLDDDFSDTSGYKITGKVVVLLTDGENNAGRDPIEAGRFAAENDIRVYYIVFREPFEVQQTILGRRVTREFDVNKLLEEPRNVVEPSNGRAYLAKDGDELRRIYEEIDQLEKSEIGKTEFRSYKELFHIFLIPGLACAVVAVLLSETVLRRIP